MKTLSITVIFLFAVLITKSFGQRGYPKAAYKHDFPKEMNEDVKKAYLQFFQKGQVLYEINCAKCHNTIVDGIEVMPEFTKEHLAKYQLRVQNPQHEDALTEMKVNAEEMQQIMIFLTYYKKVEQTAKSKK